MSKTSRNSASERTHQWRSLQKEQGNKQISSWLHSSTIESLDQLSKQNNCSRNDTIVSAIKTYLQNKSGEHTANVSDTELRHTANVSDTKGIITAMQQLVDGLNQQIQTKDHQINELIESQKQGNFIIAGFQKSMGLLEEPKQQQQETIKTNKKDKKQKTGESKKSKKKGKGKKK
jgi:hypothetical protein